MKKTLHTLLLLFLTVGVIFPNFYSSILDNFLGLRFGATNFPTSLDTLTNPSGTDSVATVSHSSQHSNANDAIEAIEAKVGITASTPVTNSFFVGTGAGTSIWSTYATGTQISLTSLLASGSVYASSTGLFDGGVLSIASSTFTGAFRFPAISQGGLYTGSGGLVGSFATTTVSCSGVATCSQFAALGSSPVTISVVSGTSAFSVATATTAVYKASDSFSVVSGDQFLIWGKAGVSSDSTLSLRIKQSTYSASTTLDISKSNNIGANTLNTQAYWIATTTETVIFDITGMNDTNGGYTSLIVESF